jgi:hypothetical protein
MFCRTRDFGFIGPNDGGAPMFSCIASSSVSAFVRAI